MKKIDLIVHDATQLLTMDPSLAETAEGDSEAEQLGVIDGGAAAIMNGEVVEVGSTERIRDTYSAEMMLDASGCVVSPGLVDPHTHAIFAGSRHLEFGMRMKGSTYLEILEAGGGIHSTVTATRALDTDGLAAAAIPRLARAMRLGVTTMEVKSGYGLNQQTELEMLEAVRRLNDLQPVRLVPTFLGAHVVPKEHRETRAEYVRILVEEMLPEVASRKLAEACDVFLDDGAFTNEEAREILTAAKGLGLGIKIHAGQFTDQGGPELIAELGGLSAEHLEVVSDAGIHAMAEAGVVANLLPGAAFSLRDGFPDGRRFADNGVKVALATDNNPGSSRSENLPLMASMGAARMGLTCAEAWKGITVNAAKALGKEGRVGSVKPGQNADLLLLAIPDFRAFLYHFGVNHTTTVVVGGKVTVEGPRI